MTNETKVFLGTVRVLEASGASITNGSVVQADDASNNRDSGSDGVGYPDAEFYLSCTFATAPTEGAVLSLYARPLDIDGTNDSEVPEATRPTIFIGNFVVNNVTSAQYLPLQGMYARDIPKLADYYIHNNGTGQTVSSGWKLQLVPRTRGPA